MARSRDWKHLLPRSKVKSTAHVQVIHIDAATVAEARQLLKSRQD